MSIAYFDTIGGISGDMTLGAFVSAGVPLEVLSDALRKLNVSGFELQASHIERSGIVATKIDVMVTEEPHGHRHLGDIEQLIDASGLGTFVKDTAKKIFRELAKAEAHVHQSEIDRVHFHEVGAVDSIVDIVGAAICLDHLRITDVYSSPVKLGSGGFVNTQHGTMPVPTPATVEILKGYPTILTSLPYELTTPTGAAIIKALSRGILSMERLKIQQIGYGAGSREMKEIPNLLRVMVGTLEEGYGTDELVTVETNIDDMNPEIYPYVIEKLLEAGAHDAYVVPVIMKKGRPGILFSVLAQRSMLDALLGILFRETTTLGVRIHPVERRKVQRSARQVQTSFGLVKVKVVVQDTRERLVPEYEECKRIALERNLPLKEVYGILEKELRGT
jgi:uncharacterized protein (TIGR00299 family) protein